MARQRALDDLEARDDEKARAVREIVKNREQEVRERNRQKEAKVRAKEEQTRADDMLEYERRQE